jgi:hypothetical protein
MTDDQQLAYQLVFKGLFSEDAATKERVLKLLVKQCGHTSVQAQEIISKKSGKIAAGELPSDLSQLELLLAEAGADVEIEEIEPLQKQAPRPAAVETKPADTVEPAKPKAASDFSLEFDDEPSATANTFIPPTPAALTKPKEEAGSHSSGLSLGFDDDELSGINSPSNELAEAAAIVSEKQSKAEEPGLGLSLSLSDSPEHLTTAAIVEPPKPMQQVIGVDQNALTIHSSYEQSPTSKPIASSAIEQVGQALDAISDVIEEINYSLPVEPIVTAAKQVSSKKEKIPKVVDTHSDEVETALKDVMSSYHVEEDEQEPEKKQKVFSVEEEPAHFTINEGGLEENQQSLPPSTSVLGIPKELVMAIAFGAVVLVIANYYLFGRSKGDDSAESEAQIQADVNEALAKKTSISTEKLIEKKFRASATIERGGGKVAIDAAGSKDGITALALAFTMNQSPELSAEEIVVGKKRLPWIEKVEFPAFTFEPLEKGTVEARAEGKGTLIDGSEKKRVVAAAVVEATVDMNEQALKLLIEIGRNKESVKTDYPVVVLPDGSAAFTFKEQIDIPFDK